MPVHHGRNRLGPYYQWGSHGKKYYYSGRISREIAKKKAHRQGIAIILNWGH